MSRRPHCESEFFCSDKATSLTEQECLLNVFCAIKDLTCSVNSLGSVFNRTKVTTLEVELNQTSAAPSVIYTALVGVPFSVVTLQQDTELVFNYIDTISWTAYFTGPSRTMQQYTEKEALTIIKI